MDIDKQMISIIMPSYNNEKYIKFALDSVLNQIYRNLEIIIIDDCSTDNTKSIILSYSDKRVKLIALDINRGAANARNIGIDHASGEFIFFLDSDDWLNRNNSLYELVHSFSDEVDAVCGNIVRISGNKVIPNNSRMPEFKSSFLGDFSADYALSSCYYRFLYRTSILKLHNINFPNYRRRQDPVFLVNYMKFCRKIYFHNEFIYSYRVDHKEIKWDYQKIIGSLESFNDNIVSLADFSSDTSVQNEYDNFIYYIYSIYLRYIFHDLDFSFFKKLILNKKFFEKKFNIKKFGWVNVFLRFFWSFFR